MANDRDRADIQIRRMTVEDRARALDIAFATGFLGSSMSAVLDCRPLFTRSTATILDRHPEYCFAALDDEGLAGYAIASPAEWMIGSIGRPVVGAVSEALKLFRLSHRDRRWVLHRIRSPLRALVTGEWRFRTPPGSRLHLNLLPRLRGRRVGSSLLERLSGSLRERGSSSIHANSYISARNDSTAFWIRNGFSEYARVRSSTWRPWVDDEVDLVCWVRDL